MSFTILSVLDVGDDVLLVEGEDGDGSPVSATGWVSATTNHYESGDYDQDGALSKGATPRAMTPAEVGVYALSLLGPDVPAAAPIAFVAP